MILKQKRLFWKNLILSFSLSCFLFSCQEDKDAKRRSFLFDQVLQKEQKGPQQAFIILNPLAQCNACYIKAIENVSKLKEYADNTTIVTDFDLSRMVPEGIPNLFILEDKKFFSLYPDDRYKTLLLIYENKKLIRNEYYCFECRFDCYLYEGNTAMSKKEFCENMACRLSSKTIYSYTKTISSFNRILKVEIFISIG